MKRIFFIFLMALLPLQAAWSTGFRRSTEAYGTGTYSSSAAANSVDVVVAGWCNADIASRETVLALALAEIL